MCGVTYEWKNWESFRVGGVIGTKGWVCLDVFRVGGVGG